MRTSDHPNRSAHNWLIYDIGDRLLQKYSQYYKGELFDLGCGEAPYREFFLRHAERYVGVDWGNSYHDQKAEVVANLNEPLPIDDDSADTVVSISVMEHLHAPQHFLDESFRILKPGGYFFLQVPFQWWIHESPFDYFRYTPYGLKHMLAKSGFEVVELDASSGIFTTIVMKLNYGSRRAIRGPRIVKAILRGILIPFWFVGQVLAPLLDKLDRNWHLEAQSYTVLSRKPERNANS